MILIIKNMLRLLADALTEGTFDCKSKSFFYFSITISHLIFLNVILNCQHILKHCINFAVILLVRCGCRAVERLDYELLYARALSCLFLPAYESGRY